MNRVHNPLQRALKRPTLRNCINAKCAECMGCSLKHIEPGFREQIFLCSAPDCPLHGVRPYRPQIASKSLQRDVP